MTLKTKAVCRIAPNTDDLADIGMQHDSCVTPAIFHWHLVCLAYYIANWLADCSTASQVQEECITDASKMHDRSKKDASHMRDECIIHATRMQHRCKKVQACILPSCRILLNARMTSCPSSHPPHCRSTAGPCTCKVLTYVLHKLRTQLCS